MSFFRQENRPSVFRKAALKRICGCNNRLKTAYNNLKIQPKLLGLQFLAVLFFSALTLGVFQIALNLYDGLLYSESAKALNLSMVNIENELKQIEKISLAILAESDIQQGLYQLQLPLAETQRSLLGGKLTEILWTHAFERNIVSVHLIDNRWEQYSGGAPLPSQLLRPIWEKAVAGAGTAVLIGPFPGEEDLLLVRQVRQIRHLSMEPLGVLVMRLNTSGIIRQATLPDHNSRSDLLIYNGVRQIYVSGQLGRQLKNRLTFPDDSGYRIITMKGHRYFVAHTHSAERGWLYVNILSYDAIFRPIIMMRKLIVVGFGLFLGVTFIISMRIAHSITKPIENLSRQMKRVERGDFSLDETALPEMARTDEIGDLQRDFAIMIHKINTLIKEDYTKQIILKDTQLRALQAQINPHFLYNTMESINWLAKMNGQQAISRMAEALGNLLRSAMSHHDSVITLGRELELLQDYIAIQQIRFEERLRFEMAISPEWWHLPIPKLTLQPLVENSIRYGLETLTGVCRISVTAVVAAEWLEIRVADNGPGIGDAILTQLVRGELRSDGRGIGLQNIADRLSLIFGAGYGLDFSGQPERGAVVRVRIPREMRV